MSGRTQMRCWPAKLMDNPLIVVNFKTYQTACGESAEQLATIMEQFVNRNYRMIAVVLSLIHI